MWIHGRTPRSLHTLRIGGKPVSLEFNVPPVYCFGCQETRQVKIVFSDPKKRCTRAFEHYVLDLSGPMTSKDVADHFQVISDTVQDNQTSSLQRRFGKRQQAGWDNDFLEQVLGAKLG